MRFGFVKDVLKSNGVSFDEEEFDARMTLAIDALRGNYDQSKVDEFVRGEQKGGGYIEIPKVRYTGIRKMLGGGGEDPTKEPPADDDPTSQDETKKPPVDDDLTCLPGFKGDTNDFLGPWMRWFVNTVTSPNASVAKFGVRILMIVIFFVSYLENLPMVGGLLGAALDLTVGASKAATKLIQTGIVTLFGIIPFGGLIGFMLATFFGWFAWTLISVISFSRQEFGESLSAIIHTAPYPMGNILGDTFDAGNQSLGKVQKNAGKIWGNIKDVLRYLGGTDEKAKAASEKIVSAVETAKPGLKAAQTVENPQERAKKMADITASYVAKAKEVISPIKQAAAKELAAKTFRGGRKSKNKWKTLRNRFDRTFVNS